MEKIKQVFAAYYDEFKNESKKTKLIQNFAFLIVFAITGSVIFVFNLYTPLIADDFNYSFSFATGESISSLNDIFESLVFHYKNTNGRLFTHFFVFLFLSINKNIFNVLNTLVFLLLGLLVYCFSGFSIKKKRPFMLAGIYGLIYFFAPAFSESFLWLTGSCNYLWGSVFILLFLLPYRKSLDKGNKKANKILSLAFAVLNIPFGFLAGMANENLSAAMIFIAVACILVVKFIKKQKISLWMFTGITGSLFGFLFLLFGNSARLEKAGGLGSVFSWIKNFFFITFDSMEFFAPIFMLIIGLFIACFLSGKETIKTALSAPSTIFILGFFASSYSMVVSPQFPSRSWTGPLLILIISAGLLFNQAKLSDKIQSWGTTSALAFVLAICTLGSSANTVFLLKNFSIEYSATTEYIQEQIKQGNKNIAVKDINYNSKYCCSFILSDDPDSWPNTAVARYFGAEKIIKK